MCYVGMGGMGVVKDVNMVLVGNFMFLMMVILVGNIGLSYIYIDVEEIFFVLCGKMKVICECDGEMWEVIFGECDLILVLFGVYCMEINIGEEDVLMCVMFGLLKLIMLMYLFDLLFVKIKC